MTEIFKKTFQLAWNSVGGIYMNFKSTAKYPGTLVGADNVSCSFIQHTFLCCVYCCSLWVSCRGLGRRLCGCSAASLGQKWMCGGWWALLWRWNGNILPGNSSASLPKKLQWMWMQEVKCIRKQAHMPCGKHPYLAAVRSSAMMPMYRACQQKEGLSPYMYLSPAWLNVRWAGQC